MPDSTEELTGQLLGPYRLVAQLGRGGMGVVYKAYQAKLTRYVALKVLPRRYTDSPDFIARFWQEARAAARLQHPHIIPIFDYGEYEGYHYIAMPLVRDGSLAQLLDSQPLQLEQMAHIVVQVGSALDYAHSQDVVHRDVKPDNVLISRHSGCLLTDFGIAKLLETVGSVQLTQEDISFGTPAYMSPEQIRGDEDLDGRSDIYSLGVVVYQMATGRVPFQGTMDAVRYQHLFEPPTPPHIVNRALPRKVGEVILKALAKERAQRYATAAAMSAALQAALPRGVMLGSALFRTDEDEGAVILGVAPGAASMPATPEGESAEASPPLEGDELTAVLRAASAAAAAAQPSSGAAGIPWPPLPVEEGVGEAGAAAPESRLSPTHVDFSALPSPPTPSPIFGRGGQGVRAGPLMALAAALVVVVALALAFLQLARGGAQPPSPQAGAQPAVETPTELAAAAATPSPLPSAGDASPTVQLRSTSPQPSAPTQTATPTETATAQATPTHTPSAEPTTAPPPTATATPAPTDTAEPSPVPTGIASPGTSSPESVTPPTPSPEPPDLSGLLAIPLMYGFEPKVYVVTIGSASLGTGGELQTIVGAARQPDYSPDGARLIVNGDGGDWNKLRLLNPLGGEPVEIGDPALIGHAYPSWSPDGSRVVYEDGALDARGWRLYVRDLTPSRPGAGPGTILAAGVGRGEIFARHPVWAGQDRFIFHGCNTWLPGQESECGMWLMSGNGGAPRRLTPNPNHVPTEVRGDILLYASAEKGDWSVYTLDLASEASRQLTPNGANEGLATFSPDGRSVAYLSDRGGRLAVWVVGLEGGEPLKLFDLPSEWGSLRTDGWGDEKLGWGPG